MQSLMVANMDGGTEQVLTQRKGPDFFTGNGVAWSPDGNLIAVGAYTAGKCFVMTLPASGGQPKPVGTQSWMDTRELAWLSDSSGVILIGSPSRNSPGQIWQLSYPGGQARRITNDLNDYYDLSLTADSETLIAVQGELLSNVWTADSAKASRSTQMTFGAGTQDGLLGLSWIPGGGLLYASLTGGDRELWVLNKGSRPRQVTTGADIGFFSTPAVCPNGRTIVFATGLLGSANVFSLDIDGGRPKPLGPPGTNGAPSCSPDGKWVYYNALDGPEYTLWRVPVEGGTAERLTHYGSTFPAISPDGKWVAFAFVGPSPTGIGIIPDTGGQPVKTFHFSYSSPGGTPVLRWSPVGDAIDYIDSRNGVANIWRQPLDGGQPRQISDFTSGLIFNFAWSTDGKGLAVARGSTTSDVVRIRHFGAR
jgi:Tol biopolymer transport system component